MAVRRRRVRRLARTRAPYRGKAGIGGPLDTAGTYSFHRKPYSTLTRFVRGGTRRRMGALGVSARHRSQTRAAFADR